MVLLLQYRGFFLLLIKYIISSTSSATHVDKKAPFSSIYEVLHRSASLAAIIGVN